jgi:bifunctional enzyme CysN/CysC
VILAVNKMDLVDFQRNPFDRICADFDSFSEELSIDNVLAIPLSALIGDNVVDRSQRSPWYRGRTLLQQLEAAPIPSNCKSDALRLPIQWVNRPDASFRGFSGTIASGTLRVGDPVTILPSRRCSSISRIVTMDGDLDQAAAPDSITVTLQDEIDVARGDMIVSPDDQPRVSRHAEANLIWMSEAALVPGKPYWFKQTTRRSSCEVESIAYRVDINTLERNSVASLSLNEIGRCQIKLLDPIAFDSYDQNRATGSFILVDRITHQTVAAGMLVPQSGEPGTSGHWFESSTMVRPQAAKSLISAQDRSSRYGQDPLTILITGLSGSGKTSVALELERQLFASGRTAILLDGQTMRLGLSRDLGFSAEERSENLRRAAEIAKLINDSGQICIAAFVAPSAGVRQKARQLIGTDRFTHVHLSTPVAVCRRRDVTGQYLAADKGEIRSFPGVTFEYEMPLDADMCFDTEDLSVGEIVHSVLASIKKTGCVT